MIARAISPIINQPPMMNRASLKYWRPYVIRLILVNHQQKCNNRFIQNVCDIRASFFPCSCTACKRECSNNRIFISSSLRYQVILGELIPMVITRKLPILRCEEDHCTEIHDPVLRETGLRIILMDSQREENFAFIRTIPHEPKLLILGLLFTWK